MFIKRNDNNLIPKKYCPKWCVYYFSGCKNQCEQKELAKADAPENNSADSGERKEGINSQSAALFSESL